MRLVNPLVRRWLEDGSSDPDLFWDRAARQLHWFRPWDRTFVWEPPTFRWFVGGQTNLAWNALDHHVEQGRGGHAALVGLNERGERRVFTYAQLLSEVERVAAGLRGLGVRKGDRLTIYMPTCPEAILLMLASVRIGAIHVVVFAGFGSGALGDRVRASGSRFLFTADLTFRKGKDVPLKGIVDQALAGGGHAVERVVVWRRGAAAPPMTAGRDLGWEDFLEGGHGQSGEHVPMESNEPAFILATSGTTAKPKLAVHTHGGYAVHIASMARWCFGLEVRRRLVVDVRHRLDRRAQLHRLRPAARGLHDAGLRGGDRPSRPRDPVEDRRGFRRHRHLHVAHGRAPADALRRSAGAPARSLEARTGVLRRGSAQRPRLGVAPGEGPAAAGCR